MAVSRLGEQIRQAIAALDRAGTNWALIGGLALASHRVVRATQDVDFLVDAGRSDAIDVELSGLGYANVHRSADAATYLRSDERVDLLYASRPIARRLLCEARRFDSPLGPLRVVSAEGLIGFKVQAYVNQPFAGDGPHAGSQSPAANPYAALDDLMAVVESLCPRWPEREPLRPGSRMLL